MDPERHGTRRRVLGLIGALGVASLAGCTDDEDEPTDGEGDGEDGGSEGTGPKETGEESEADETGAESGEEHGAPEDGGGGSPNVEGTNLFVRVVDGEGAAIEGAVVRITGGSLDGEEFATDADGRVIRRNVEPGEYTVTASVGDREDERRATVEEGDDEALTFTFSAASEGGEDGSNGNAGGETGG
ncbi:carboxypeptidase-like regulatory domain-containing protein [Halalkalicoccus sp. NIPERK01]|uniref:carboxypeptidase-like regulatory domain-containing protein n=1 Tax=Halalkalicoccus sp. NIPERK01 TaxID=3053469 RepID=UPI00256EF83C|nr:carboxypeptidase-like regulatory domain-containing protein [Halalkalicoccus sp. NIPERK01]MDL5362268.1 carboxypeptidase-like regulatory domain-containing protein [Halalkalicoccus sp. NIPERK01]